MGVRNMGKSLSVSLADGCKNAESRMSQVLAAISGEAPPQAKGVGSVGSGGGEDQRSEAQKRKKEKKKGGAGGGAANPTPVNPSSAGAGGGRDSKEDASAVNAAQISALGS